MYCAHTEVSPAAHGLKCDCCYSDRREKVTAISVLEREFHQGKFIPWVMTAPLEDIADMWMSVNTEKKKKVIAKPELNKDW